jgi:ubiquinone/menaquinone biosynthesis C-methylase UbiE
VGLRARLYPAVYDRLSAGWEKKHAADFRGRLVAAANGRVLEIGVGTGFNLPYYPEVAELVITDPSEWMLRRAKRRASEVGRRVKVVRAPAQSLPFEDGAFDTVVSMAVLCSVPDQREALHEVRRVLRPGGQLLFSEHVRSDDPKRAKWQDRLEGVWKVLADGCHPNRDTLAAIEASGFELAEVERGELPGVPSLVRPLVTGRAVAPER